MKLELCNHKTGLQSLNKIELIITDGGGFAYDAGRCLRFAGKFLFGGPTGPAEAVVDWIITDAKNETK